jgi:transposase-like protein
LAVFEHAVKTTFPSFHIVFFETYIKVRGKWKYFYRAVDSNGDTIDFMLSAKQNRKAAKRFFKKALNSNHNQIPRVITVDENLAYPPAIDELKNDKILPIDQLFGIVL